MTSETPGGPASLPPDLLPLLPGAPLWWRRLVRVRGVRPLLGLWLLLAVVTIAAWLLTPAQLALPGDEALGTIATGTIKANRDTEVIDAEATAQRRDEAARSVWPVYQWEAGATALLQARMGAAFGEGRRAVEQWQRQNSSRAARVSAAQAERARGSSKKALPEEAELLKQLLGSKDEFLKALQAVIDDEDYLELARAGFDPTVERAAARLAGLASGGYAVAERELLAADRERGITVHTVGAPAGAGGEKLVRDIDRIRDLAHQRAEVDRLAPDQLSELSPPLRRAVAQVVRRALRPNLAYDDAETRRRVEEKRAQVKDVLIQIRKGEKIIGDGEPITRAHLLVFRALRERGGGVDQMRWGSVLLAALVCAALFEFGRRNVRKFRLRARDVLLLATLLVVQLMLVRGSLWGADRLQDLVREALPFRWASGSLLGEFLGAAVPLAAGSMLVRFLLFSEAALIWTAAFAPLCGLLAGRGLQPMVMALVAGVVAADRVAHAGSKAAVFRAGLWTAAASAALLAAFALFQVRFWSPETAAQLAGAVFGNALLLPLAVLLLAPLCELVFGVVTDIRLLQLASFNHPVLKDLIVQAPGTYHHSIVIGALVEAAAREIGANPLLARVGAYYHDIGKGKNPLCFGENQRHDNQHDQLTPQTSAEIILAHVRDGIELARKARLPAAVIDFIPQHHGTRVVGYFFHKAREDAARAGLPPPDEALFRYAGPKPQSREAALVMLGDMVVATARTLTEATQESLGQLVEHAIAAVVADKQLDECDLTLRDLERIQSAFTDTLLALLQARASQPPAAGARPVLRVLSADSLAAAAAGRP